MKKVFAVLVALALVLSCAVMAFAAGDGKITITNAVKDATYNVYKMFDFAPVSGSTTQGRYTVVAGWEDFLAGAGAAYLKANTETGTIEWVGEETDARKAELAKAAVAYAKANSIAATASATASSETVEFTGLDLGYYAIDTSLGTLCALTNTNSTFTATEKNEKPDIDKWVQEDKDDSWGKVNDADIDQVVNYKSTITVGLGATNYVMHDTMEAGLTFNADSVVVKLADGTDVAAANYTVNVSPEDGHTFDVAFNNDFIAGLAKGTQFTVYYSATLNEKAKIVDDGNDNTVFLTYGEDNTWTTAQHTTSTFTWKIDVLKYTMNGDNKDALAGAKFQLLKGNTPIKFTQVAATEGVPTYMVDEASSVDTITTDENGTFYIVGLDEGSYALHETEAPAGYNKLAADLSIIISSTHDDENLDAEYEINKDTPATIEVENKTGSLLPETGGIGTTIFYVVGGLLMVAALVVLVSKKRMAAFA
ncbi:MAG: SpaH/EbpB family LPXTG-anchored major pilin [Clostridia bacterium]|nr:SpaH/EbpB family LPXTG-anchored major pilin [Clostridia bacterium]